MYAQAGARLTRRQPTVFTKGLVALSCPRRAVRPPPPSPSRWLLSSGLRARSKLSGMVRPFVPAASSTGEEKWPAECAAEEEVVPTPMTDERELAFLLDKLRRNRGIDFRQYQRTVLERRIRHRLNLTHCETSWDYVALLNKDPEEYDRLIECLTIKVSEFFRDAAVFTWLRESIVPQIIAARRADGTKRVRAWSCGAALGQEAFSLAILFRDALGPRIDGFDLRIVATDIDRAALEKAPWGSYVEADVRKLPPHLLFKYFTRAGERYVLKDSIRSLVSFEYHDVLSSPVGEGMDLALCRNVLIYFQKALQKRALTNLHQALAPAGFLVLGSSESLASGVKNSFDAVDLPARVYRKC